MDNIDLMEQNNGSDDKHEESEEGIMLYHEDGCEDELSDDVNDDHCASPKDSSLHDEVDQLDDKSMEEDLDDHTENDVQENVNSEDVVEDDPTRGFIPTLAMLEGDTKIFQQRCSVVIAPFSPTDFLIPELQDILHQADYCSMNLNDKNEDDKLCGVLELHYPEPEITARAIEIFETYATDTVVHCMNSVESRQQFSNLSKQYYAKKKKLNFVTTSTLALFNVPKELEVDDISATLQDATQVMIPCTERGDKKCYAFVEFETKYKAKDYLIKGDIVIKKGDFEYKIKPFAIDPANNIVPTVSKLLNQIDSVDWEKDEFNKPMSEGLKSFYNRMLDSVLYFEKYASDTEIYTKLRDKLSKYGSKIRKKLSHSNLLELKIQKRKKEDSEKQRGDDKKRDRSHSKTKSDGRKSKSSRNIKSRNHDKDRARHDSSSKRRLAERDRDHHGSYDIKRSKYDHSPHRDSSNMSCHICGKTGHWKMECPFIDVRCHLCGKNGHWKRECPTAANRSSNDDKVHKRSENNELTNYCHICGKSGHWKRECPDNKLNDSGTRRSERGPMSSGLCHLCGKTGHWKRECPTYRSDTGRRGSSRGGNLSHGFDFESKQNTNIMQNQQRKAESALNLLFGLSTMIKGSGNYK